MKSQQRGSTLIVVILVIAFMLAVGIAVLTVTSTGPKISGNVRDQEEAFNAAEAGFDASRKAIEDLIMSGTWVSFSDHSLDQPVGIDIPFIAGAVNPLYFRRNTDEEVLAMIEPYKADINQVLFYDQPYVKDTAGARRPPVHVLGVPDRRRGRGRNAGPERHPAGLYRGHEVRQPGPGDGEAGDRPGDAGARSESLREQVGRKSMNAKTIIRWAAVAALAFLAILAIRGLGPGLLQRDTGHVHRELR